LAFREIEIARLFVDAVRHRWLALLAVFAFAAVAIAPLCGAFFRCGCTYLWAGGDAACNINNPAPPYCPWCVLGTPLVAAVSILLFLGAETALAGWTVHRGWNGWRFLVTGLALFFVLSLIGWRVAKWLTGYPL